MFLCAHGCINMDTSGQDDFFHFSISHARLLPTDFTTRIFSPTMGFRLLILLVSIVAAIHRPASRSYNNGTITLLGVVIGSEGVYCDAFYKAGPLCSNQISCTLPIDQALCTVGTIDETKMNNEIHIMCECGGNFQTFSKRMDAKSITIGCAQ